MKENPLVTVLMPAYNGGEYLRSSIESIIRQTYKYFEFLIINDCSTDNSLEIINSFRDQRIVVHTNPFNIGQTKSLNVGLKLASGQYIVINDADDLSLPHRIEKQLDFILRHPEYVVVGSSSFIMDRSGRLKRTFYKPVDPGEISLWILSDTPIIHGSVMMNKEVILANGGYNEEFRICQDYELWSSLIRKGFQAANLPDKLVIIRHYRDSISFKERDAQTVENGEIMHSNITALTKINVTLEDAIRQRLFYAIPEQLSMDDFRRAEELLIREYSNLNHGLNLDHDFISCILKKVLVKPYCKMAMNEIKNGRLKEGRRMINNFIRRYGASTIPLLILIASYGGKFLSYKMMDSFEKWQEFSGRLYYNFRLC